MMPRLPQTSQSERPRRSEAVGEFLGIEGDLGAPVTAVLSVGDRFVVTTGDGRVAFASHDFETAEVVQAHGGAIRAADVAEAGVLTGGDDGRVLVVNSFGATREIWRAAAGTWIDRVAVGGAGAVAWSCGRSVRLRLPGAQSSSLLRQAPLVVSHFR